MLSLSHYFLRLFLSFSLLSFLSRFSRTLSPEANQGYITVLFYHDRHVFCPQPNDTRIHSKIDLAFSQRQTNPWTLPRSALHTHGLYPYQYCAYTLACWMHVLDELQMLMLEMVLCCVSGPHASDRPGATRKVPQGGVGGSSERLDDLDAHCSSLLERSERQLNVKRVACHVSIRTALSNL
jgi:hypothetical protein